VVLASAALAATSDPNCTGSYGGAAPRAGRALRLGIDPGIAGSAGGAQLPSTPDDGAKDLAKDPRFSTPQGRTQHVQELDAIVEAWTRQSLGGHAGIDDGVHDVQVVEFSVRFGLGPLGVEAYALLGLLVEADPAVDDGAGRRHDIRIAYTELLRQS